MQVDNSQFSEEQRAEVYRVESMQQMQRQTKALESIRSIMIVFTVLFIVGAALWLFVVLSASTRL